MAGGVDVTGNYNISYEPGTLEVTASSAAITITAASARKVYDGTALTDSGFAYGDLPLGVTRVEAVVEGSQTAVGSSANVITRYTLWNGETNVTTFFPEAILVDGTLTVTPRSDNSNRSDSPGTTTTIPDSPIPLAILPEPLFTIVDDEVPLGRLPQTGGGNGGSPLTTMFAWLATRFKWSKEDDEQ
jgi:hypothetical protein